jgi:hypothetical protein
VRERRLYELRPTANRRGQETLILRTVALATRPG